MRTVTIIYFGEHGIMAHYTTMAKSNRALESYYPMIQFLITINRTNVKVPLKRFHLNGTFVKLRALPTN